MKALFIFLFSISAFAQDCDRSCVRQELRDLGVRLGPNRSVSKLREFMAACNVTDANAALYFEKIVADPTLLDCLKSKRQEVLDKRQARQQRLQRIDAATTVLKNQDCTSLNGQYQRAVCIYLKGQVE